MSRTSDQPPRAVGVHVIQDISDVSRATDGFLRRHRVRAKTILEDGLRSDAYVVDYVDRQEGRRDAAALVVYSRAAPDEPALAARLLLRRQHRYAAYIAVGAPLMTEVVAGIIDAPETPTAAAQRELLEEAGIQVSEAKIRPLGRPFFPSPGVFTERIFCFAVEVAPEVLDAARPQGHEVMEEGAEVEVVSLSDAFVMLDADPSIVGNRFIADAKTEIILYRLRDYLGGAR